MKACKECGFQCDNRAKFCPECGSVFSIEINDVPPPIPTTNSKSIMSSKYDGKVSVLGILAIVFAIMGCTFFVGIILAIIDLCQNDRRKKWASISALVISGLWLILAALVGSPNNTEKATIATSSPSPIITESKDTVLPNNSGKSEEVENSFEIGDTLAQQNAYKKAKTYLNFTAFSYEGLRKQLEFEGFSTEDAIFGVDNCGADWYEQAVKKAESYMNYSAFSREGLIEQLEYEGFTTDEATYAANYIFGEAGETNGNNSSVSVGKENALEKAKSYLNFTAFSYSGLIEQLEFEGFSSEDARYGADNCGADWYEQAAEKAKSYLDFSAFSRDGLIEQLEYEGFTHEQAVYGAESNGF